MGFLFSDSPVGVSEQQLITPFLCFQLFFFLSHVHKGASESHYPESPRAQLDDDILMSNNIWERGLH